MQFKGFIGSKYAAPVFMFLGTLVFCGAFGMLAFNPIQLPFLGFRVADTSLAPDKLILKQGSWKREILRESIEFICLKPSFYSRGGGLFMGSTACNNNNDIQRRVQVMIKIRKNFVAVSKKYDSCFDNPDTLHTTALSELKRIADAYNLPTGVCN